MSAPQQTLEGVIAWASQALGTTVRDVVPLTGGLSAGMVGLTTTNGRFALRWWEEPGPWPSSCLHRQQAVLDTLAGSGLPVPRCLAWDETVPAALTTWLPGRIDLDPADPDRWLDELATTLAAIHQVPVLNVLPLAALADDDAELDLGWLGDRGLEAEALAVLRLPDADPPALLHGDYQHFNVLWDDGRLSGVIDWPMGGAGDRGLDVGHCRLNLAVLYGVEPAMAFLDRYEAAAGRVAPAADLRRLLAFTDDWTEFIPRQVAGRRACDVQGMADRVRQTIRATIQR